MPPSKLSWLVSSLSILPQNWTVVASASLFGLLVAMNLLGKVIRNTLLVPKLTLMEDLKSVGQKRTDGRIKGRAVVCGGSIAGLLAAAVCSDHFESVLIIESEGSPAELGMDKPKPMEFRTMVDGPNALPTAIPLRKRLIQYLALHGFLPPTILGLQKLFPVNLKTELDYFGCFVPFSFVLSYCNKLTPEVFKAKDPRTPLGLGISRQAFETLLRRLVVKSRPNVSFMTGTINGFKCQTRGDRYLSGVTVKDQDDELATFIVDATGPTQSSYHRWLENSGFGPLPPSLQDEYDPCLSYAQSVYTLPDKLIPEVEKLLPDGLKSGFWSNLPEPSTGETRLIYMYWAEDSHWLMIASGGWGVTKEQRPHGIDELREYTKSLHNAEATPQWIFKLYDLLEEHGDECSPWFADYHPGKMSFIKYHEAQKGTLPSNWVAVGDATIKLNPIYGQGCTKAMIDAVTLDSLLRLVPAQQDLPLDFSDKFFRKVVPRTRGMWDGNKANDYGFSTTQPAKGETLDENAFMRAFSRNFIYAGLEVGVKAIDPQVAGFLQLTYTQLS
ncbi:hypothetical protein FRB97_006685 [Tulasnella sp. 331]|nr:hypothetical protein FRB97_006685 [Tulasnella sp. 331]